MRDWLDTGPRHIVVGLRARLAASTRESGDTSFTDPAAHLVAEVQQGYRSLCGRGLQIWIWLERLRGRVERVEQPGGIDE